MTTTSNWRPHPHMSIIILVTFLFLLEVNAEVPFFSFNMESFVANQPDLIFQGDAQVSSTGVLEVTQKVNGVPVRGSTGRTLYSAPFHIWEASFVTHLSFVIKAPSNQTADGLAFFIAPPDSEIPLGSGGGLLGLFSDRFNDTSRRTVAVEFDTCFNVNWDPPGLYHIGINVNSIQSVETVPWEMKNGEIANAVITYFADTNYLGVTLVYGESQVAHELGHFIDLKKVVPEWVRIGISATVGLSPGYLQSHDVLSWSFHAFRPGGTKTPRDAILQFLHHHHPMALPKQSY